MSIEDKASFDPIELEYANKKDTCNTPRCDLHGAAKKVPGEAPADRISAGRKITGAKGVLHDALLGHP